ncbi:hypothetical protein CUC43_34095 (plasmid) [Bacillus thuringiensis LM1212]|uniref:hypothetical protein n=1 Tax=Bacillus cereus group TaxID=86661 RepID=UPI000496F527|nr:MULTISPECIES: hypothetical protein [Bacillus cereus group]AXY11591.1 hypothetical protein CUC43_34095 [Bacillus thuringiensis LM1212]QDF27439.1 hypothetical protein FJR70_32405 [Bacillus tropicus]QUG99318.1 hypothetical protein HCM98_31380 [Bacillus tropicus]
MVVMMDAITTGIFQVPTNNSEDKNNVINILLENPSSTNLTAYLLIEHSKIINYGVNSPVSSFGPFKITVDAHSTQIRGLTAAFPGSLADVVYRVLFWGDIDLQEEEGKLSVQILAGTSSTPTSPKLSFSDASVLFRHENFVKTSIQKKEESEALQCDPITILKD